MWNKFSKKNYRHRARKIEPTPELMPESGGEELTTSDGQRTSDVIEPTPEATPEITPEPELTTSDGAEPTPVPELSQ